MKQNRKKIINFIVSGITVLVIVLLLMFNSGVEVLQKISGWVVVPVEKAAHSVFKAMDDFFTGFSDNVQMAKSRAELEAELARLQSMEQQYKEAMLENERLKQLLNEAEDKQEFSFEYAEVIASSSEDYLCVYTLNKGSADGVAKDMPVIAVGGLAGRIISVSEHSSVLMALTDSRSSVPGIVESTRDTGMVKGYVSAGQSGVNCTMTNLPIEVKSRPGDIVKTSGRGGVFPKGIYIGEIIEVSTGDTTLNTTVVVQPSVDFAHLEEVLIVVSL